MKNEDLRPCTNCGGTLTGVPRNEEEKNNDKLIFPSFGILKFQKMTIDRQAVNSTMGLYQHFGNFQLAQVMSPDPEFAKKVGEKVTIFLCADCLVRKELNIMELVTKDLLSEKTSS